MSFRLYLVQYKIITCRTEWDDPNKFMTDLYSNRVFDKVLDVYNDDRLTIDLMLTSSITTVQVVQRMKSRNGP